jgi:membrane-associated phospholipid phosphatase
MTSTCTDWLHPALLAAALAALVTAVLAQHGGPLVLDRPVADALAAHGTPDGRAVAGVLTQLGSGAVLFPLLLAIAAWRRTAGALGLVAVLAAGQVLEVVLLSTLGRTGMPVWEGSSFSSGHTATAALGWGLVALGLSATRRTAVVSGLAAGAVVGLTRAYLGLHWLSDVTAGLLFGLLVLVVAGVPAARRLPRVTVPWRRSWWLPVLALPVALVPPLLEPSSRRLIDLAVYVGSAGVVGEGGDVYGYRTQAGLPFTYPPFAALVAEPLDRMPLVAVQVGWTVATLAALVAVARLAMAPVVARIGLPLTLALLLLSTPVRSHLRFGQVGVFLVLLVSVDLLGRQRGRGWGVGLAAALKLTPAIYLPWMLVTGARRRLRATVGWAGGATVVGLALLWQSSPTWLTSALWDSSRFGGNAAPGNQSVRGMLLRSGLAERAAEHAWMVTGVLLLVAGTLGAKRLEQHGDRLGAVGVLAATSVAVSPISWQHHLVWLVLPIAALVAADRCRLAAAWTTVLIVPVTTLGRTVDVPVLGALLVNTCALTAVAAVLLLPRLLSAPATRTAETSTAPTGCGRRHRSTSLRR